MKQLLLMDAKNYEENIPEIRRVSVRGISFLDGKLILAEEKNGFLKLPGGGQDEGETDTETLAKNLAVLEAEGRQAWNQREYRTLLLIKEYLDKE